MNVCKLGILWVVLCFILMTMCFFFTFYMALWFLFSWTKFEISGLKIKLFSKCPRPSMAFKIRTALVRTKVTLPLKTLILWTLSSLTLDDPCSGWLRWQLRPQHSRGSGPEPPFEKQPLRVPASNDRSIIVRNIVGKRMEAHRKHVHKVMKCS